MSIQQFMVYQLNYFGYLYIINGNDYEINSNNSSNEYIIKTIIKPDRIEKVYYNNIRNRIKYLKKKWINFLPKNMN